MGHPDAHDGGHHQRGMHRGEGRGPRPDPMEGPGRPHRRRMFDAGELRLVLLHLIVEGPRHGYDLIQALEHLTAGVYAPSPGIVYPTLTLLQDMGLIAEEPTDGARKVYAATPQGMASLADTEDQVQAVLARLKALGAAQDRPEDVPVRRAMENLRSVLRNRLLGAEVPRETLHAVVAILDEAAQRIERL
jgi:DNA-binding PadR family transcriptional regulator